MRSLAFCVSSLALCFSGCSGDKLKPVKAPNSAGLLDLSAAIATNFPDLSAETLNNCYYAAGQGAVLFESKNFAKRKQSELLDTIVQSAFMSAIEYKGARLVDASEVGYNSLTKKQKKSVYLDCYKVNNEAMSKWNASTKLKKQLEAAQ